MTKRVAHNKGVPASLESRIKRSIAAGGRPFVSVVDGVIQEQFYTIGQAATKFQVDGARIREALKGLRKRVRGHSFKYLD